MFCGVGDIEGATEQASPIAHVAHDFGMHPETLRKKVRQAEADSGARPELLSGLDPVGVDS